MTTVRQVIWKDEGDFGFITTLSQDDLDYRAANPRSLGVPFDPNRVRQYGTLTEAKALASEHDAELVIS
jgi:hypothetical protein